MNYTIERDPSTFTGFSKLTDGISIRIRYCGGQEEVLEIDKDSDSFIEYEKLKELYLSSGNLPKVLFLISRNKINNYIMTNMITSFSDRETVFFSVPSRSEIGEFLITEKKEAAK